MERQTKHRILGILVIIGLVIILLPLFQGNKELSTDAALVQAPPFPDQPVQVTTAEPESESINPAQQTAASPSIANLPQTSDSGSVNRQPDDVISATHPSVINNTTAQPAPDVSVNKTAQTAPLENTGNDNVRIQLTHSDVMKSEMAANKSNTSEIPATTNSDTIKTSNYRIIEGEKAASILKKSARNNKHSHGSKSQTVAAIKTPITTLIKPSAKAPIDDDGLIKLNSAVWVIQIGSFKNKANALRIVNELRSNGYRAFIQQITTALGDNTRVFVGPEHKRTTARALADRLQSEMHIQGIVISYKPLTL